MKVSFILLLLVSMLALACDNGGKGTTDQQRAEARGDENRLAPGLENPQEAERNEPTKP
jgi:hypothetical protein